MDYDQVRETLETIRGCSFATLDSITYPKPGLRCETRGQQVMLFVTKGASAYEKIVRRRLARIGKSPDSFVVGPLPWGEHIEGSPCILHNNAVYLQTIEVSRGDVKYYVGDIRVNPKDFGVRERYTSQGLPKDQEVHVNTYRLENITRLRVKGRTFDA